ncbi:MAG: sulfatase-like hydrolase/transferase [Planctomycetota bacterium]
MGDGKMVTWAEGILRAPPAEPFFLAAGIYRPHLPWYAPRHYFDMYPPDAITMPPIKADDLDDLPAGGREMAAVRRGDLDLVRRHGRYPHLLQAYLANVSFCDALVGRLLEALDSGPARDRTIVVLWSDRGWHFGEKEHLHKFTLWERSTRVPLVVAAPGVTAGGRATPRPAGLIDLFPTLCELCGLPPAADLDGRSLVPLLRDPDCAWNAPVLITHGRANHALRDGRYRYIRYADGGEELYDHAADPHEWTNLAGRPEHEAVRAALAARLPASDAPALGPKAAKQGRKKEQAEREEAPAS